MKKTIFSLLYSLILVFTIIADTTKDASSDNSSSFGSGIIGLAIFIGIIYITVKLISTIIKKRKEKKLQDEMLSQYPNFKEYIINKKKRIITQGMPFNLVSYILGKPGDVKERVMKENKTMKCFYGAYRTQKNTINYRLQVDFENNIVVGWKQL